MSTHPSGAGPALDESGRPYDQIRLVGITATGYHGVFDSERAEGQIFRADVVVHLDTRRAAATDDLTRTMDYGALAAQVAGVLAGEPVNLIETLAERIAATALAHPSVAAVDVSVHKPQAPVGVPFDDIVVTIRRDHNKLPAAEPWRAPASAPATDAGSAALAFEVVSAAVSAAIPSSPPLGVPTSPGADDRDRDRLELPPAVPVEVVLALGSNVGSSQDTLRLAVATLKDLDGLEVTAVSPLARTAAVGGPDQADYLNAVVLATTTLSPRALLRSTQAIEDSFGREHLERWGPRTLDIDLIVYGGTLAVTDDLELPHPRAHQRAFVLQPWTQIAPDAVLPGLGGGPVAALAATAPDRAGIRWLALDWLSAPPHPAPVPAPAPPSVPVPIVPATAPVEPGALEPAALEPGALEPGALEPAGTHIASHGWMPDPPLPAREPTADDLPS